MSLTRLDKGPGNVLGISGAKIDLSPGRSKWRIGYFRHRVYEIYNIAPPSACISHKSSFVAIRKSTAVFNRDYDAQAAAP